MKLLYTLVLMGLSTSVMALDADFERNWDRMQTEKLINRYRSSGDRNFDNARIGMYRAENAYSECLYKRARGVNINCEAIVFGQIDQFQEKQHKYIEQQKAADSTPPQPPKTAAPSPIPTATPAPDHSAEIAENLRRYNLCKSQVSSGVPIFCDHYLEWNKRLAGK